MMGRHRTENSPRTAFRLPDDAFPGSRMILATSMSKRLRGLLFADDAQAILLLAPCRDIHTFGMRFAIDVAFVDGTGEIIEVKRDLLPNKRVRNHRAAAVLERKAIPRELWFEVGEVVSIGTFCGDDLDGERGFCIQRGKRFAGGCGDVDESPIA